MKRLGGALAIATLVTVLTFALFCLNFWVLEGSLPGYRLLAYPGIALTRLFSEELAFWPKVVILLSGQFVAYFGAGAVFSGAFRRRERHHER